MAHSLYGTTEQPLGTSRHAPTMTEREVSVEARREAAPAALAPLMVLVGLASISRLRGWELLGFQWWIWLVLAFPSLLLAIDLVLTLGGAGLVRSRRAALVLLALLVAGNLSALALLVTGLATIDTATLGGGELLLSAGAIWTTNVIVFGLLFWELESGGPGARALAPARRVPTSSSRGTRIRSSPLRDGPRRCGTTSTSR